MLSTRIARNRNHKILGRIGGILEFIDPGHLDRYANKDLGDLHTWKFKNEV